MNKICCFVFLAVLSSCLHAKKSASFTTGIVIIGDSNYFQAIDTSPVQLYYDDLYGLRGGSLNTVTVSDRTPVTIPVENAIYLNINNEITLLAQPFDTLVISSIHNQVSIQATNTNRNKEINFYQQLARLRRFNSTLLSEVYTMAEYEQIEKMYKQASTTLYQYYLAIFDSLQLVSKLDEEQINNTNLYKTALGENQMFWLYSRYKKFLVQNGLYESKLGELKDYFNSLPYKPVLYYNAELYSYSKEVLPIRNKEVFDIEDVRAALAAINNTFKNAAKDYLLSNLMMYAYAKRIPIPREIHAKFNKECDDADYKKIVANERIKQRQLSKIPRHKWYLAKANSDKSIRVEELLKVYKGKYVLLDFWATWCGPCIADMLYLKQFAKDYLSRDVMVIGISVDKNKQMWEKFMLSHNSNPQTNYNIKRSSANILFRGIAVETIPRYMLLDRNGKVMLDSLPSASSPEFRNKIDSVIERN